MSSYRAIIFCHLSAFNFLIFRLITSRLVISNSVDDVVDLRQRRLSLTS